VADFRRPPRFPCQFSFHQLHHSLFFAPLPSNRSPIVPRVCFCRNVFSDQLPSNGHGADRIENNSCTNFSIVAWVYFGSLRTNGSTCHNIMLWRVQSSCDWRSKIHRCFGGILPPFPGSKCEANNQQEAAEYSFASYSLTLKKEALFFSETTVKFYQTGRHISSQSK
jgi:hypothetical protein